ncbi:MAG: hypothetical protein ACRCTE_08515 [Cellulosilyticaceae bacterium]
MNDQQLENLLTKHFEEEQSPEAGAKLVYEARQKAYVKMQKKRYLSEIRPLVYMVLLHLLWTLCSVGVVWVLRGAGSAVQAILGNIMMSTLVVITGCIVLPQLKKSEREERV